MQTAEGKYLVDLPPVSSPKATVMAIADRRAAQVSVTVVKVELTGRAREIYDEVERLSQERFTQQIDGAGAASQVKVGIPRNASM